MTCQSLQCLNLYNGLGEWVERLSVLVFGCSFSWLIYTATTRPERIPLLQHLDINGSDFDWFVRWSHSGNARVDAVENYQEEVDLWADDYDLPAEYLMSLIILECGGQQPCGKRFEHKRYKQLMNLRDGKRRKFEYLRRHDLEGLSDTEIRSLATSWGPFQIMGYHSIGLSKSGETVTVDDLMGPRAVEIGVRWIDENYGVILRHQRYKDAFHMHNTGRVYPKVGKPKTHDPNYVPNGLSHMTYFEETSQTDDIVGGNPDALSAPNSAENLAMEPAKLIDMNLNKASVDKKNYNGW